MTFGQGTQAPSRAKVFGASEVHRMPIARQVVRRAG
jgi:hypothetical protein